MDLSLDNLGFSEQQHKALETITKYPQGMLLVTGPTGSGKIPLFFGTKSTKRGEE